MKQNHTKSVNYDEREFEKVVNDNKALITSIIKNMELECGHFKLSWDDLYQEGLIALHEAYVNYDGRQETKFSTFAYMVIHRKLHKYYYQQITHYQNEIYSLDNTDLFDYNSRIGDYVAGDHGIRYEAEDRQNRIDKLFTVLNEEDQYIVALRAYKNTYEEIANKLNISKKRIDNRLLRIKDRFIKNNMGCAYGNS